MYSKANLQGEKPLTPSTLDGRGYHSGFPPTPRAQVYRKPMEVPPGYSGHAIVDGEDRWGQAVPSASTASLPAPASPVPRFDDLPRISESGARRRDPMHLSEKPPVLSVPLDAEQLAPAASPTVDASSTAGTDALADAHAPRRSSLFDPAHFPFGHGLGFDEWLLLGLILLLLHEGRDGERGDLEETVILLGLLLLGG